jgi:small-conductance mechanosensitive channel
MNLIGRWNRFAEAVSPFHPYNSREIDRLRSGAKTTFFVSLIFQCGLILFSTIGWVRFGATVLPLVSGVLATVIIYAIVDWSFWREVRAPRPISNSARVGPLFLAGVLTLIALTALAIKLLGYVSFTLSHWLFTGVFLFFGVIGLLQRVWTCSRQPKDPRRRSHASQVRRSTGLAFGQVWC